MKTPDALGQFKTVFLKLKKYFIKGNSKFFLGYSEVDNNHYLLFNLPI